MNYVSEMSLIDSHNCVEKYIDNKEDLAKQYSIAIKSLYNMPDIGKTINVISSYLQHILSKNSHDHISMKWL